MAVLYTDWSTILSVDKWTKIIPQNSARIGFVIQNRNIADNLFSFSNQPIIGLALGQPMSRFIDSAGNPLGLLLAPYLNVFNPTNLGGVNVNFYAKNTYKEEGANCFQGDIWAYPNINNSSVLALEKVTH